MGDHIRLCRLWVVFFVVFGMGACGGGNEPDTTPPRIVSANPADKMVKVSVTTDIKIIFSEPLDPATVTTSTFSIDGVAGARVSLDDRTHAVTIRPSKPLSFDATYQLTCAGVKDKAGNEMQKTALTFSTYKMSGAKSVFYRDGLVNNYGLATYDIDGRLIRWADNIAPGPDGVWFTSDDVAGRHYSNTWDGQGNLTRHVDYVNSGADGISWTADDGVDEYLVNHFDERNRFSERESYFDPGPDNLWFTPDDKKGSGFRYFYDADGRLVRAIASSNVGSDGVYADNWHASYDYDARGNRTREVIRLRAGIGADGIWFTDDDEVLPYTAHVYDVNGNVIREINYTGSHGLDGKLFTPDDGVSSHTSFIFDAKNNKTKEVFYDVGTDGVAQISDDRVRGYSSYIYNGNGKLTRVTRYSGRGDDSVWFTTDDGISSYTVNTYDDNGNKIRGIDFNGAGKDGVWVTADDTAYEYTAKTFDAHGNQLRAVSYYDAGVDGLWLTQDDKVFGYTLYMKDAGGADIRIPKTYFNPGADGIWFTRDDVPAYSSGFNNEISLICNEGLTVLCTHSSDIMDSKGNITRAVGYKNAGADGIKHTVDDEVLGYIETIYDAQGNPVKKNRYNGSGGDGIWFTGDDVLFSAYEINLAY